MKFCTKTRTFFGALMALFSFSAMAQNHPDVKYCGSTEAEQKFMNEHPALVPLIKQANQELENFTKKFDEKEGALKSAQILIIPVVFHILHDNGAENISDAQVYDAMRILNEDYRKLNPDTSITVAAFKSIAADVQMEFRLAQKDPNGICTNGIDRIWSMQTYIGDDNSKLNPWPRNKYLNVWVVKAIGNGAAGYTYTPGTVQFDPGNDGIMILNDYIGSIGTGSSFTSRALTHEVGHWFNLLHTWGSTNQPGVACGDDNVSDTPVTKGWDNCNLNGSVCNPPVIENVQNYMEYSYCETMFTQKQVVRMRSAANSSTAQRNNLWTTTNLAATGTDTSAYLCSADFNTAITTVCAGKPVQFSDASYNASPVSWQWTFNGGEPYTAADTNPSVIYFTPGTYDVSLTAGNGTNTFTKTKNSYITVLPSPGKFIPFSESFETTTTIPDADWMIFNPDNSSFKWQLQTGTGYTGTQCLKMNNYGDDTLMKDDLLSSSFDLSNLTSATIKFKVAYVQVDGTTNDKLSLYVSTNCGQTWAIRFAKTGAALATLSPQTNDFTPSSAAAWTEFTASLNSTYLTEDFRMKFTFQSYGGNNLYLDDINITGVYNPVPIQISPVNNSTGQSDTTTIDWKAAGNVDSYEYQLDVNPAFNSGGLITGTKPFISLSPDSSDTEFQANNLTVSTKYYWRVRSVTGGTPSAWSTTWNFTISPTGVGLKEMHDTGYRMQIHPNPANDNFFIEISLDKDEKVVAEIYDVLGKKWNVLINKNLPSGKNQIEISSANLPAGIYVVKLNAGGENTIKKLVISR